MNLHVQSITEALCITTLPIYIYIYIYIYPPSTIGHRGFAYHYTTYISLLQLGIEALYTIT